ncbi:hypothetical protein Tco_1506395, partial [Tanacetum coccineum]
MYKELMVAIIHDLLLHIVPQVQSSVPGTQIVVNISSKGKFVPELGALIHEKSSNSTQFIDFKGY